MTSKRLRSLDVRKSRAVTTRVSVEEHAALHAYAAANGTTVSGLIHELIAVSSGEIAAPAPQTEKYISAKLDPKEVDVLTALAQAAGMEPLAWLRLMLLARSGVGAGAVLVRQIEALGIVRPMRRSGPTPEQFAASKAHAQAKRVEAGLPAVDPDDVEYFARIAEGKKLRAEQAKQARKKRRT